jgi:imidazolonepropionase
MFRPDNPFPFTRSPFPAFMPILRNIATLATCRAGTPQADASVIPDAALAWDGDHITWVGAELDLPANLRDQPSHDAAGRTVIPGLVDCHTHLAFGGWRADEFEQRITGASYLEIAERGGGIMSTVRKTREASEEVLHARASEWLIAMRRLGVTTVECKSGYGLDRDTELRLLHVYRTLANDGPSRIVPTYLGAHVVPPEYRERRDEYLRLLIEEMIPRIAREGLAECCDVFVERSAFSADEGRRILHAARAAGLQAKVHADQLTDSGGAALAAEVGALSADHLEHVSEAGIAALAAAGVVAVSLPLATLYLDKRPMPARRLLEAGVPVAVATDFNPGSAPSYHLPFAMTLACNLQRMTPAEVLMGATIVAARAVGRASDIGSLEVGKRADFAVIDAANVTEWLYFLRENSCVGTVIGGRTAWSI